MPIYAARYNGHVKVEDRYTQVTPPAGPVVSSWVNVGGSIVGPTSFYGKWYEAQYERSREVTPPADDASRVCPGAGSSSFNSVSTTTYEIRWTLKNPLIACTVEYALRTFNGTSYSYGSFSSFDLTASAPTNTLTVPVPGTINFSNSYIWRCCFRPFMSHTM